MIDSLMLSAARITTLAGGQVLTNASGFFFQRDGRLYLVTSRHVVLDEPSGHHPDSLCIELHTDADNLASTADFGIPLYNGDQRQWRQAIDSAGEIDVAVIELQQPALPPGSLYQAFTPQHLLQADESVEIGSTLLVVGFPLGFQDTLHRMPVARHAGLASSFGLRFHGLGYFLTDGRTHRGLSGAPVVKRASVDGELPWHLLGIHSTRLLGNRDEEQDEALGLNCTWYADILMTLTE
ncbi:serine protease [Pseudomonas sp. GOM7]|uniref:S1 family peptidase n=1 Tax=unclassified Pseudomonas TaxID=196821 RepID=UPI00227A9570|nr:MULTISPECIES: serine protease [unclassified Pseudomonas]WAJ36146.1 serine protease [Pseudomonas sp. GOM7]